MFHHIILFSSFFFLLPLEIIAQIKLFSLSNHHVILFIKLCGQKKRKSSIERERREQSRKKEGEEEEELVDQRKDKLGTQIIISIYIRKNTPHRR